MEHKDTDGYDAVVHRSHDGTVIDEDALREGLSVLEETIEEVLQ